MKQVTLVCRAATFGNEQKLVFVARHSRDFDFCWQVVVGIDFFKHGERRKLAVAQVAGLVRVVDAARDCFVVGATSENKLTLLGLHNCSARVLTHWQHAARRDACVLQQIERNEPVVIAGLWVGQNVCELLQVAGAKQVRDVAHCMFGQRGDCRWIDFKKRSLAGGKSGDAFGGDQSVFGGIGPERKQFAICEWRVGGHASAGVPLNAPGSPA